MLLIRAILNVLIPLITRLETHHVERLHQPGGLIVVCNHIGILEVPLAYYLIDRNDIIMLVAEKHKQYALARWLGKRINAIWTESEHADFRTLRTILRRLQAGEILAVAPEGTRSPTGALIEARHGVSYLAAKTGVPILPASITGTGDKNVKDHLVRLRRVPVTVNVGQLFSLPIVQGIPKREILTQYTDEIMCRIAALLPPEYRGVYADHPRLFELLQESSS